MSGLIGKVTALNRHVPRAINRIEKVLEEGETTHEWQSWRTTNNIWRLKEHLQLHIMENQDEDHLAHLVARGLFMIQMREEAKG